MKNILIYGTSGHARTILDVILKKETYVIKGFVDSCKPLGEEIYGYKVIGNLKTLSSLVEKHNIKGIILAIEDNSARIKTYKIIKTINANLKFISIIHPEAIIASDVVIQQGALILAGAIINPNAKVGKFCILNANASLGHDSTMDDFSSLASSATIGGKVSIGYASAIYMSATVIQNISIGKHTVIGAAALVLKNIGDYKMAYGAPIHTIVDRNPDDKYLL